MSINRKILAFTGIRSDYDLLSGIYKKLAVDPTIDFKLIVSGAHLSHILGYTLQYIEKDNLPILCKIESLIDSNTSSSRIKSASILLQSCIHSVVGLAPDAIMYAGDREDAMAAALLGAYTNIPTIHFFGGDHTSDGNVDNPVRHAISKLSSLHFVIHEEHKKRLISIGEEQKRIHVVGSPALDRFKNVPYISKENLLQQFRKEHWENYALAIHHPILGYEEKAREYFKEILLALKKNKQRAFVSYPNTDAGNRDIISIIQKCRHDENFYFFKNLDRDLFINLIRHAQFMIGNSSAGIIEAAIVPLGVVNVGERQKSRLAASNVIFVDQGVDNISKAIKKVLSASFQTGLESVKSIYGDGHSVDGIVELLIGLDFNQYKNKTRDPLKDFILNKGV